MVFKIKVVVMSLSMLMICSLNASKQGSHLNNKQDNMTSELNFSSNKERLVNFLLTEQRQDQFSFIQVDESSSFSYMTLLQEMNKPSSAGRVLKTSNVYLSTDETDSTKIMFRQIFIWLPITLGLILYFTILALIDMPIQKNSILYAKYGTSKQNQVLQ